MNSVFSHDSECLSNCDTHGCKDLCVLSEIHRGQHYCDECLYITQENIRKAFVESENRRMGKIIEAQKDFLGKFYEDESDGNK
jgi:hypothetical protein